MTSEISYLTVLAVSVATVCFMIAIMHFVMWVRTGLERQYLFSMTMVAAAGCVAIFDLLQIRSTDIASYVMMSRFMHVGLMVMLISLLCFIRTVRRQGNPDFRQPDLRETSDSSGSLLRGFLSVV